MEPVISIFVVLAVMTLTAVLFGGWVIVTVIRVLAGGVASAFGPKTSRALPAEAGWSCRNPECRGKNPSHARYCRRCGQAVVARQQVSARRVAAML